MAKIALHVSDSFSAHHQELISRTTALVSFISKLQKTIFYKYPTGIKMRIYCLYICFCVCVCACVRWRGLCPEQRLMPHFSIRCVYLFERAYRTSRTFGGMKRRRTRATERETELCEGIKYDCRYAHTVQCEWTRSTGHTACRLREADNHSTAEWCVSS